jgi:DNA polymerase-3 subunit gamma/tau
MLNLLLQKERDLKDSSLPQVVVELALITAAQLPHLAPLDSLVKGAPASSSAPISPSSAYQPAREQGRYSAPPPLPPPLPQGRTQRPVATKPMTDVVRPSTSATPPAVSAPISSHVSGAEELIKREEPLRRLLEDTSGEIIEILKEV